MKTKLGFGLGIIPNFFGFLGMAGLGNAKHKTMHWH